MPAKKKDQRKTCCMLQKIVFGGSCCYPLHRERHPVSFFIVARIRARRGPLFDLTGNAAAQPKLDLQVTEPENRTRGVSPDLEESPLLDELSTPVRLRGAEAFG
eukprot:RCo015438